MRGTAIVLTLMASVGSTLSQAYPSRDFDPVPSQADSGTDAERTPAKAWYDRDFDVLDPAEVDPPAAARDFDAVEPV